MSSTSPRSATWPLLKLISGAGKHLLNPMWAASIVSAGVLVLGVSGTLSAWTSAIITNSSNTVATANAVILKEVGPDGTSGHVAQTCYSSSGTGNSFTCANINKYGGITTPLAPGASQTTDVTFTNVGAAAGATFQLAAGLCSQTPGANAGATPPINNLCSTSGELTVAVSCSNGATYAPASAWTDLVYAPGTAAGLGAASLTHTTSFTGSGALSWTCRFTVALNSAASVNDQAINLSQPLTWTLAS